MTTSDVYMRVDLSALEREPRVSPLMTAGLTYRACVPRAETVRRENYTGENKCDVGLESGEFMLLALLPDWEAGRDGAGGVFCGVAGWGLRLGPVIGERGAEVL